MPEQNGAHEKTPNQGTPSAHGEDDKGIVLIRPDQDVPNGARLF